MANTSYSEEYLGFPSSDVILTDAQEKLEAKRKRRKAYLKLLELKAKLEAPPSPLTPLTRKKYIFLTLGIMVSIENFRRFSDNVHNEEGMIYIIPYTIIYFTMATPLLMCQTFLGQYGHQDLIRMWSISPAFIGLGITYILYIIVKLLRKSSKAAVMLTYFTFSFHKDLEYSECPPANESEMSCYATAEDIPANFSCSESPFNYASHYHRYMIKKIFEDDLYSRENNWLATVAVTWILCYLVTSLGLVRISKALPVLLIILFTVLLCLTISILQEGSLMGMIFFFTLDTSDIFEYRHWFSALEDVFAISETETAIHIIFGSMLKQKTLPQYDAILVSFVSYTMCLWFCILTYCITGIILHKYGLSDKECIAYSGYVFIFSMLPEFIRCSNMSHHMLNALVFIILLVYELIYMSIFISAVCEVFLASTQIFHGYKNYLQATFCILCFILGTVAFGRHGELVHSMILFAYDYIEIPLTAAFSIPVFYIYGIQKVYDDFHFTMGYELTAYWKICWKILGIGTLIIFPYFLAYKVDYTSKSKKELYGYYLILVIFSPILISLVVTFIHAIIKYKLSLMWTSTNKFGPISREEKRERRNFMPRLRMRYRESCLRCKHKCLVNNALIKKIVAMNEIKRKKFLLSNTVKPDIDNVPK